MELLGGVIWVESELGKGSSFHFCLPLLLADTEKPRTTTKPPTGPVISMDDLSAYIARKQQSYFKDLGTTDDDTPQARRSSSSELILREQELDPADSRARRASSSEYEVFRSRDFSRPPGSDRDPPVDVEDSPVETVAESVDGSLKRAESEEMEGLLLEKKVQLKILLAEDNPINQKVASRLLQKHGHVVVIVGDGQQALESVCAQHDELDLVLMDVQVSFSYPLLLAFHFEVNLSQKEI